MRFIGFFILILSFQFFICSGDLSADNEQFAGFAATPSLLECISAIRTFSQNQRPAPLNIAQINIAALLSILNHDFRIEADQKKRMAHFLNALTTDPNAYIEIVTGRRDVLSRLEQWADAVDQSELSVRNHLSDLSDAAISGNQPKINQTSFMRRFKEGVLWTLMSGGVLSSTLAPEFSKLQTMSSYVAIAAGFGLVVHFIHRQRSIDQDSTRQQRNFERNGIKSLPRNLFTELLLNSHDDHYSSDLFFWTVSFTTPVKNFLRKELGIRDAWLNGLKGRTHLIFISTTADGQPILFFASGSSNF